MINLLPDRSTIGHRLLHVSLLRLSKLIYFGGVDGTRCPQAEAKVRKLLEIQSNAYFAPSLCRQANFSKLTQTRLHLRGDKASSVTKLHHALACSATTPCPTYCMYEKGDYAD